MTEEELWTIASRPDLARARIVELEAEEAELHKRLDYFEAENARLREALRETLAVAARNEDGDFVKRAKEALHDND